MHCMHLDIIEHLFYNEEKEAQQDETEMLCRH